MGRPFINLCHASIPAEPCDEVYKMMGTRSATLPGGLGDGTMACIPVLNASLESTLVLFP